MGIISVFAAAFVPRVNKRVLQRAEVRRLIIIEGGEGKVPLVQKHFARFLLPSALIRLLLI